MERSAVDRQGRLAIEHALLPQQALVTDLVHRLARPDDRLEQRQATGPILAAGDPPLRHRAHVVLALLRDLLAPLHQAALAQLILTAVGFGVVAGGVY